MKITKNTSSHFLIVTLMILSSCTEVIDIDLNSSDPQIVIEGSVSTKGESVVKIAKSVNFDESNDFPKVQNAIVELSDNLGNSEILVESSEGIYSTTSLGGVEGRTYSLTVQTDDKYLESVSTIPNHVSFDSLIVTKASVPSFPGVQENELYYDVRVVYNDPIEEVNFYRFVETINNEIVRSYVFDDRLNNGEEVNVPLLDFSRQLVPGDVLEIEMQCIDEFVYEYFNSFANTQGSSATPANPYTNIIGSELGYFNAHTSEGKEKLIR
ncbi:MAG: DUF4249 domain-containing protein [Cyclobacteriaceae bacterium]|jgi:hypothetical protein